ncbi:LexA DNA binding domain-containing protein [Novosphingobium sp. PhB165]|uniref:LexA family protein n=1 Tax=Novosphingobium sp. PhB165 TaxID=2485105 RepID=UPI001043F487|nr:hypothetical protein [Novosphingobium sp. PhB165]TCM21508.1 LexA DNA binding domain-containing protein [Novosphingobium sp. PhB165]
MIGLTAQQSRLLTYLKSNLASAGGIAPSYDEMAVAVGCAGKSSAYRLVMALEERGFIRRVPHRARAIELVDIGPLNGVPTEALVAELARRGVAVLQPNHEVAQALGADRRP